MKTDPDIIKSLMKEGRLLPQEEMLEIARKKGRLKIGVPCENTFQERRVALVPEAVSLLVANGHEIKVETKAGENANFSDRAYSEAGAEIVYDRKDVFQCDIVFKVSPPVEEEVEMMEMGLTLISALQISMQPRQVLQKMMKKKITAIAWDYMRDEEGHFPVVSAMGEIAGNTSIHIAAELLNAFKNGKGVMLGGIAGVQPTEVVILGAGTVGEFAAKSAIGLGCSVKVFDNALGKLRRLQSKVGQRIYTSIIQPKVLSKALMRADVVIGAVRSPFGKTPCIVSEEMVSNMKSGSIVIDVSIDQGGCFETSELTNHEQPTFDKYGVTHYCVPNIASRVSRTASFAISNIFAPVLIKMGEKGGDKELIKRDHGFRCGVYMYKGTLTSEVLGKIFDLNHKEIELLLMGM
ncbi:alanine dehydrogenase [Brumimicrobium aurantiacum]|uniref:alanine dehydrogenase n=1 Tax=Brumimicrobium aurantiacum TaxID=1737063 RepID=A0A3E1EWA5_9FLAO|nr:alanine dehydrogenase [Brumimicrobium aurantiacum]RFC53827.1 alanine dehydrogenase [Brumimicrobium aurantiacum]